MWKVDACWQKEWEDKDNHPPMVRISAYIDYENFDLIMWQGHLRCLATMILMVTNQNNDILCSCFGRESFGTAEGVYL